MAGNDSDDLIISISTDLATVKRSLNRLVSDVGQASSGIEKRFAATGKAINNSLTTSMQDRINSMVGIGTSAAKEWNGVLADQQKELDRLRAKYSPLFATISNYKSAVAEIRQAHAAGAISANEMAAAIQRERQAALASTAAIKGRNAAIKATVTTSSGNSFNTANIAAQLQDIGVTAAMGMSPIQIALQQGTQLSAVLQQIKDSGQGVGQGLAAAFASVISPLSLVTIGVIAAGTAAFQYFSTVMSEGGKSAELLKEQAALIAAVAERWGDAVPALREYADQLKRAQDGADLQRGAEIINTNTLADVRKEIEDTRLSFGALERDLQSAGEEATVIKNLQSAFAEFAKAAEEGKTQAAEVERVQNALSAAINSTGLQATSDFAAKFRELAAAALSAADSVQKVNEVTSVATSRINDPRTWRGAGRQDSQFGADATIQGTQFPLPDGGPVPDRRPSDLDTDKNRGFGAPKRARAPKKTASDRLAEDLQSIRDRTEALRQEMSLIGLSNEAQVKRRTALDLEQRALADLREEARKKGEKDIESIKLSPDKVAAIEQEAAAYARQSEALRKAQEQQQKLNEWNNVARDATRGFIDDLIHGESAADAFANALSRIADALLDDVLESIFQVNSAAGGSGGLLGGLFSLFGGGGGLGKNYFPSAPLPMYASGTSSAKSGLALVGEKGPELVRFGGGEQVIPNHRLASALSAPSLPDLKSVGGGAGSRVAVTFSPVIDARGADAAAVARIDASLQRTQRDLKATILSTVRSAPDKNIKLR
ncbi:phage tail length tape measure family protein [Agrobacterium sp. InxBP2]|uniref:phage tail length tape measure family protein n=1 Tax=Agrobacterium sp. InxBP2 TaxID=2870329 RepID=UPI00249EB571|nr:phage tail length tape measure family protein [Agrobacterium sp. InxBP2]MCW8283945.1 phage tail length tape measure family protein [Agrobacterium sp. InxBP2]